MSYETAKESFENALQALTVLAGVRDDDELQDVVDTLATEYNDLFAPEIEGLHEENAGLTDKIADVKRIIE